MADDERVAQPLTDEERKAIRALERLAKTWPPTLMLQSWSGTLFVARIPPADWDGRMGQYIITSIPGIHNDGGDPDD